MTKLKYILFSFAFLTLATGALFTGWLFKLNDEVKVKLSTKKFLPPTEYYSAPEYFFVGMQKNKNEILTNFRNHNYRLREPDQKIFPGDYAILTKDQCFTQTPDRPPDDTESCLIFSAIEVGDPAAKSTPLQMIAWNNLEQISQLRSGNPLTVADRVYMEPQLVAQFIENEPILQKPMALGEMPTLCLNAVLSIEDSQFLEHSGVSLTAIGRALIKNIAKGGSKQGGSTITQQLVKNYFLTSEKTLKRKFIEFFMSLILESHASKDEILETYLNIIYLGQTGPFQIRGFGAASQYYFEKPIENLNIGECALLAAVVNSPGLWDPFRKPENAIKRRKMVLQRMRELNHITTTEEEAALAQSLPKPNKSSISETAPYYLNAANKQLQQLNINLSGVKIFTGLQLKDQTYAQEAVRNQLNLLESSNAKIKALKEKGQALEGALLSADNKTGLITAVVGGRSYRLTQFNRATDGHRQIGSIMKPFVYLASLGIGEKNGKIYDPVSPLLDEKFVYKYDKQTWSPDNYGKKYYGTVPAYFALKNSLNAATASLGLEVGLDKIAETGRDLGIKSELPQVPSLTLGASELYPMEVLEAYASIARMGSYMPLSFVRSVINFDGQTLYQFQPQAKQNVSPEAAASLVSMMKQTVVSGTAKLVTAKGFLAPAAGKTGTTSDNKDAWFAGFTPDITTVTWVGYDNNTSHGLTGATGPVPIWIEYMKSVASVFPPHDFQWPETTEPLTWTENDADGTSRKVELIFRKNQPRSQPIQ